MPLTENMSQSDLADLWHRLTTPIYLQVGSGMTLREVQQADLWLAHSDAKEFFFIHQDETGVGQLQKI